MLAPPFNIIINTQSKSTSPSTNYTTSQEVASYRVEVHLKVLKLILGDSTPNEMCRSVSVCVGLSWFVSVCVGSSRLALSSPKIDSFQARVHLKIILVCIGLCRSVSVCVGLSRLVLVRLVKR